MVQKGMFGLCGKPIFLYPTLLYPLKRLKMWRIEIMYMKKGGQNSVESVSVICYR